MEIQVRSALWRAGLRFRKNVAWLPGKPDIVFTKSKTVVFLDSCFWHGCPAHLRRPKSNQEYWQQKIARNQRRDVIVNCFYEENGWTIIRFWEHDLKEDFDSCVNRIILAARKPQNIGKATQVQAFT